MSEARVNFLPLTRVVKEIKEERRAAFEEMLKKRAQNMFGGFMMSESDPDLPKDELGRTVDYYKELGIEPPADLMEETKQVLGSGFEENEDEFGDEDFLLNERRVRVPEKTIDMIMEADLYDKVKSLLILQDGRLYFVKETVEQIDKMIEVCRSI